MTFAEQLVELRLGRCLSQEELADASAVSVRTISNLERGATSPRRSTVHALAGGLGLDATGRAALEAAAACWAGPVPRRSAGAVADRSASGPTVTLPAAVTSIIGLDNEIMTVARLLLRGDRRLVAITGLGGVGKSRLALEVAWRVADRFDRADTVDLSALGDRDEALVALAATIGVPASATATVASVSARIGDRSWLLLLDSLEHVPEMTEDLTRLVGLCPRLRVLVTTRIRSDGEVVLGPLPPDRAVLLLVERARAVRPGFELTEQNADTLTSLCTRLDGLPLAIELAAGHLRNRELAEIEAELGVRATTLRADVIDVPGRHRTLRDTVAWSADRLTPADRLRFATLGSFRGAVPRNAWEAVLRDADLGADGLGETAARLAAISLVSIDPRPGHQTVVMLDTIREVAEDLLAESGFEGPCRSAHARHMFSLVRSAKPSAVESNLDNVRAALRFALTHDPSLIDPAVVTRLDEHLTARGRFAEAHRVLAAIASATLDAVVRGQALLRAGVAANINGDSASALDLAARAIRVAGATSDAELRIASLNLTGGAHKAVGALDAAHRAYLSCLDAATRSGHTRYITVALNNLGTLAHDSGAYAEALAHYERSLDLKRSLGDRRGIAIAMVNLANLRRDLCDYVSAREHALAAVRLFRDLADPLGLSFSLVVLAEVELGLDQPHDAERAAREALEISVGIDHTQNLALAQCVLGDLDRFNGRDDAAEARYVAALDHVVTPVDRVRVIERLAAVRAARDVIGATALLVRADHIRRACRYVIPPLDRALATATRRRLGLTPVPA